MEMERLSFSYDDVSISYDGVSRGDGKTGRTCGFKGGKWGK
nr:hypothetical protein [uncultured Oribacterium sp.]